MELVWDDGVAPETALDLEAAHITTGQMVGSMAVVAAFFCGLLGFVYWVDVEKNSPVVKRKHVIPYDGLRVETGLLKEEDV